MRRTRIFGRSAAAGELPTAEDVAVVEAVLARGAEIVFGAPVRCPRCGDYGSVEQVDAAVAHHRCPACDERWRIVRAAIPRARRAVAARTGPIGDGLLIRELRGRERADA